MIYVIQAGGHTPALKIGTSADPAKRLRDLQTSNACKLTLLATAPGGLREEKQLHRRFKALRLRREWFEWDQRIVDALLAMGGSLFGASDYIVVPEPVGTDGKWMFPRKIKIK